MSRWSARISSIWYGASDGDGSTSQQRSALTGYLFTLSGPETKTQLLDGSIQLSAIERACISAWLSSRAVGDESRTYFLPLGCGQTSTRFIRRVYQSSD